MKGKDLIAKLWAHYVSKYVQSREDFLYSWNRRHDTESLKPWMDTLQGSINEMRMINMMINSTGIGWDKYGLENPIEYAKELINGTK